MTARLFGFAVVVRALYLAITRPPLEGYHWFVADDLLHEGFIGFGGAQTAAYDPLYPLFLAAARWLSGDTIVVVQGLQLLVDAAGAVLLYRLTHVLTGNSRAAVLAGGAYAVYPLLVRHAVVADEFAFLSVLLLGFTLHATSASTRGQGARAGLWLGVAVLTRIVAAPLVLLAPLAIWLQGRRQVAVAIALAALAVMTPWLLRNYSVSGTVWPVRSGENLFHGNSRYTDQLLPRYNLDLLEDYGHRILAAERPDLLAIDRGNQLYFNLGADRELDRYFTTLAWREFREAPADILALKLKNVAYFFWPRLMPREITTAETRVEFVDTGSLRITGTRPRPMIEELAYTLSFVPVLMAAVAGAWIRRARVRGDMLLWVTLGLFLVTSVIYFPATRYRAPVEFVLLFYAATAADSLVARCRPHDDAVFASRT